MAEKMSSTDDSFEVAGELDDALNELGMLAAQDSKNRNRSDFIKDKWSAAGRRGYPLRYPLRREKEREISWCSGSSSSSSTGSSSRRSSSTSSSSGGSFCSSSSAYSRSYSRSSLISSYSIAETPTGNAPLFGCSSSTTTNTSSSNSSLCSSIDLMDQPMSGVSTSNNFKSIDFPKVLRRVHHQSYKPYNLGKPSRRFSLQLGIHREERSFQSDNLNLRSGLLSDSEASSGSGTGTPPPPSHHHSQHHHPPSHLSFQGCTLILDPGFNLRLKSPSSLMFKETKSNPGSPTSSSSEQPFRCDFRTEFSNNSSRTNQLLSLSSHDHEQQNISSENYVPSGGESGQVSGMSASSLGFRGGIPTDLNVTCCYGTSGATSSLMTRSKSLDDLNYALLLQDNNSSCSSDAFGFSAAGAGGNQVMVSGDGSSQYDVQRFSGSQDPSSQQQLQQQQQQHQIQQQFRPFNLNESLSSSSSSSFLPSGQQQQQPRVCSSSSNLGPSSLGHEQVYSSGQQPSSATAQSNQPQLLLQPNSSSSQVAVSSTSCDNLFESVVQRIGRLEM